MEFIEDLVNLSNANNKYQIQDGDFVDPRKRSGSVKSVRAIEATGFENIGDEIKENMRKYGKLKSCKNITECNARKNIVIFNSSHRSKYFLSYQHLMSQLSQLDVNLLYTAYYDDFRVFDYEPFP